MKLFQITTARVLFYLGQSIKGLITALGIFFGLALARWLGMGGIEIRLDLLLIGLLLAEAGTVIVASAPHNSKVQYCGAFVHGIAWWVWSLNLPFLAKKVGWEHGFHFIGPALLIGTISVAAHLLSRRCLRLTARLRSYLAARANIKSDRDAGH